MLLIVCPEKDCGRICGSKRSLYAHVQMKHGAKKKHECLECGRIATRLYDHVRRSHKITNFEYAFKHNINLSTCEICGTPYFRSDGAIAAKESNICGERICALTHVRRERNWGKKEKGTIKCEICDELFFTRQGCNRHLIQAKNHNISIIEYAEKYKTEEWVECETHKIKGESLWFYMSLLKQESRKHKCCCLKCGLYFSVEAHKQTDFYQKAGKKLNEFMKEQRKQGINCCIKSVATRKANDMDHDIACRAAQTRKNKDPESFIKGGNKAHQTRLKNGTYDRLRADGTYDRMMIKKAENCNNSWRSKPEKYFCDLIAEKLKELNDILFARQVHSKTNNKIDGMKELFESYTDDKFVFDSVFKYRNQLILLQVDGVYFHGFTYETLEELKEKRPDIYKAYLKDRRLEDFCQKNGINIIKITDVEIMNFKKGKQNFVIPYFVHGDSKLLDDFLNETKLPIKLW